MLLHESTGEPYRQGELRSLYEEAFAKSFDIEQERSALHDFFQFNHESSITSHGYEILSHYSIQQGSASTYSMPGSVEIIAGNCARSLWWGASNVAKEVLYLSPSRTNRIGNEDFDSAIRAECSIGAWDSVILEDLHHLSFIIDKTQDFNFREAPEGFPVTGTRCYSLPGFPKGCALFLKGKAQFDLSAPETSTRFPETSGEHYRFEASFRLRLSRQTNSLLLVEPSALIPVWMDKSYPNLSIQVN